DDPVVQLAVVLELERTDRVRDALERVLETMGEVVHRIDAPLVVSAVMMSVLDAVEYRVAHLHVWARQIDLSAQDVRAARKLPRSHAAEEVEVLLDRAAAIRG